MTCKLSLFCFSSLRRCHISRKQLYRSLPLYSVLCVRVQVKVSKPQLVGCTSISPDILAAIAVCYSLRLHPQCLNRFGPLKTVVAFHYIPTKDFWFSKTRLVGLQIHVFVLCLCLNSLMIYLFIWKKCDLDCVGACESVKRHLSSIAPEE